MNTYLKYDANVFLAKCPEPHQKGEEIPVTTKYGKENECIVHNLIYEEDGFFFYSITRADGFNLQERAKNKADRYNGYAANAEANSNEYYNKSNKDAGFLGLGEPIKVGHHSEKRHRRIIEQAQNNMSKSVSFSKKAADHADKSSYWESGANDINLSMPDSLGHYEHKLQQATEHHEGLKSGKIERLHSFSLPYAKKEVNDLTKKLELAKRLWA